METRIIGIILCFFSATSAAAMTEWFPFELHGGHITIPVEIGGIDGRAILDTGAQSNGINKRFLAANELTYPKGERIRLKGVFGEEQTRMLNQVPTRLFEMDLTLSHLIPMHLGDENNQLLLGAAFFRMFVIQLDYPNQKIRLIDRDAIDVSDYENIKMRRDRASGFPIVRVNMNNDKDVWLILDTGNAGGILVERNVAENYDWLNKFNASNTFGGGVVKATMTQTFLLPSLTFGPYELGDVKVTVPAPNETINVGGRGDIVGSRIKGQLIRGLLGYDVLKHFVLTMDYKGGHLHVGLPQ
ncbi:aspartyl protease family protein [Corallincola platygyrae]|uniref:Aspartyl protease family protein n=1 Tax=Corallincola platygyrae TaxID=1193278 RepID=A0ABW4XJY8_9GAMM